METDQKNKKVGSTSKKKIPWLELFIVFSFWLCVGSCGFITGWQKPLMKRSVPDEGEFTKLFLILQDGTIKDLQTGLVWQKSAIERENTNMRNVLPPDSGCSVNGYCWIGDHITWRVPTISELLTLSDHIEEAQLLWVDEMSKENSLWGSLTRMCIKIHWICGDTDHITPFASNLSIAAEFKYDSYEAYDGCECESISYNEVFLDAGKVITLTMEDCICRSTNKAWGQLGPSLHLNWIMVRDE
jgi:hypothetical protein